MPAFSKKSQTRLNSCHPDLRRVFEFVVQHFDCSILEGARLEDRQNFLFSEGKSKLEYPDSSHNTMPSNGVDAVPYPVDWDDRERFSLFAGYVIGIALMMGIKIRWGGDWDSDYQLSDNRFDDLPHFELV